MSRQALSSIMAIIGVIALELSIPPKQPGDWWVLIGGCSLLMAAGFRAWKDTQA